MYSNGAEYYSKMLEEFENFVTIFSTKLTTPNTAPLENRPGFFYLPTIKNFYTLHFVVGNLCPLKHLQHPHSCVPLQAYTVQVPDPFDLFQQLESLS